MKNRKFLVIMSILVLTFTLLALSSCASITSSLNSQESYVDGKYGEKISWSISKDGLLDIKGEGEMPNDMTAPWASFDSLIQKVKISNKITTISDNAFSSLRNLTQVSISGTVESIGNDAFSSCNNLTSITIPSSVESIGNSAFYWCNELTSITFEEGSVLKSIGEYAFRNCSKLTSITIPSGVDSIGEYAFQYCYKLVEVCNLSSLNITKGSSNNGYIGYYAKDIYTSKDHASKLSEDEEGYIIYTDGEKKSLIGYRGDKTELTIPSGITEVNQYAFYEDDNITSITIPSGVESIGYHAFYYCENLTSITFEEGSVLKSIGGSAFDNCLNLTSITIPSSVEYIGGYAFNYCDNLSTLTFEDTSNWYKIYNNYSETAKTNWQNKTNGEAVASSELSDASTNASNFRSNSNYRDYYWYKKDAE